MYVAYSKIKDELLQRLCSDDAEKRAAIEREYFSNPDIVSTIVDAELKKQIISLLMN